MNDHQLAQIDIALPLEPLTSARLAGFVATLDEINALADSAPGFVWRLQTEDGDASAIRAFGDGRIIVTMTVWTSPETPADFAPSPSQPGATAPLLADDPNCLARPERPALRNARLATTHPAPMPSWQAELWSVEPVVRQAIRTPPMLGPGSVARTRCGTSISSAVPDRVQARRRGPMSKRLGSGPMRTRA
ncbi:DUF3291 domain-containing protein [Nocardia aurantia]|uniref:DUF3291 domain-containing protein n=1 Tax=Nocardia aurantia TaxID=2585199 RepID=A0A7K0DHD9_9NOCA|nr:DUF3291 domain-containing protein [Nocardia aurantia]MQY25233.1 hypothetical protein [Nocardia aurantia]